MEDARPIRSPDQVAPMEESLAAVDAPPTDAPIADVQTALVHLIAERTELADVQVDARRVAVPMADVRQDVQVDLLAAVVQFPIAVLTDVAKVDVLPIAVLVVLAEVARARHVSVVAEETRLLEVAVVVAETESLETC